MEDEFVPGVVIVRFKEKSLPAEKAGEAVRKRAGRTGSCY
jgi:hypothetical protein